MGERVVFLGGPTIGRHHFPFRIHDSGASHFYPVSVDLHQLAQLFWRPRTWGVSGSASIECTGTHGSHTFNRSINMAFEPSTNPRGDGTESDLVKFGELWTGEMGADGDGLYAGIDLGDLLFNAPGGGGTNYFRTTMFAEFYLLYYPEYPDYGDWQPKCLVGFKPSVFIRLIFATGYSFVSNGGPGDPPSITDEGCSEMWASAAEFLGGGGTSSSPGPMGVYVMSVPLVGKKYENTGGYISMSVTPSFEIKPFSYFEYATREGAPVWDATTGASVGNPIDPPLETEEITGTPPGGTAGPVQHLTVKTDKENGFIAI